MLREITIKPALNGWIVRVGCQTLVFESTDKMLIEMRRYLNDPEATEEEYREHALNAKHVLGGVQIEETRAQVANMARIIRGEETSGDALWADADPVERQE